VKKKMAKHDNANNLNIMLTEAISMALAIPRYMSAAKVFHWVMLEHLSKVQPLINEHALLVHTPELPKDGSLLDGYLRFLDPSSKDGTIGWCRQDVRQTASFRAQQVWSGSMFLAWRVSLSSGHDCWIILDQSTSGLNGQMGCVCAVNDRQRYHVAQLIVQFQHSVLPLVDAPANRASPRSTKRQTDWPWPTGGPTQLCGPLKCQTLLHLLQQDRLR
jgi:hypothetical protein